MRVPSLLASVLQAASSGWPAVASLQAVCTYTWCEHSQQQPAVRFSEPAAIGTIRASIWTLPAANIPLHAIAAIRSDPQRSNNKY